MKYDIERITAIYYWIIAAIDVVVGVAVAVFGWLTWKHKF